MAIGTGGLTGTGLFAPEHIFVPNAWNDFIFAYLANVLGFVGAAAVLGCCWGVCLRTLTAALQSRDALGRNICVGIFAALFLQTVINLGMNPQVLPVIGVTPAVFLGGRVECGDDVPLRRPGAECGFAGAAQPCGCSGNFVRSGLFCLCRNRPCTGWGSGRARPAQPG